VDGIPILTLSLQNMRFSMVQALVEYQQEIAKICDEQMKTFIDSGEITKTVQAEFNNLFRATLKDALRDAVHKAMWSKDVTKILETTVHDALIKVLREYYPASEPGT
jgi:hypothetical protein